MYTLVLIRHGESKWNKLNLFTGWVDVDLSPLGKKEAKQAGKLLKKAHFKFDIVYTSNLRRAIHTMNYALEALKMDYLPVVKAWQLNERHYGALQGLNKVETAQKYGEEQVKIWRRSFDVRPPEMDDDAFKKFYKDKRFKGIEPSLLPRAESLKDTIARVVPYFDEMIKPLILAKNKVLIVAHGNSIRALVKYFEDLTEKEIMEVNIPTGIPLVYELNKDMKATKKYYLGDEALIRQKEEAVKNQGKKQ
jgi:2,3-bisphosphoglycerate-dependent phosphoglycerate mutase